MYPQFPFLCEKGPFGFYHRPLAVKEGLDLLEVAGAQRRGVTLAAKHLRVMEGVGVWHRLRAANGGCGRGEAHLLIEAAVAIWDLCRGGFHGSECVGSQTALLRLKKEKGWSRG